MVTSTLEPVQPTEQQVVEFAKASDFSGKPMDATDRCDACGAQAYSKAISPTTSNPIMFCNHHIRKNKPMLTKQGFKIEHHLYSFSSGIKEIPGAKNQG